MQTLPQTQSYINSYGVLITIVDGLRRQVFARAIFSSKESEDVELRSNISEEKLKQLSVNKVYMIAREGLQY